MVHWDLRESMKEADIQTILQRAKERHPDVPAPHHFRQRPAVPG
jgi:hypothetical protein